ncbi:PREDICTED: synaptotagmin-14 isoform X4 [Polistes canadensis]|uniref:synaptotagmin-14 isoform X4 n=1 Tax=Polistes canadensis TaxID=91411 RepID=UPI000718CB99|nr:PREDICTED: synaptotagmin-14 isoform X4 [Polistes canadensis]
MTLAGSDHFLTGLFLVPVEATAFLGAVAGFIVLLLAIFLYLSRKWCFTPPTSAALFGGVCVPLCDSSNSSASQISKNIGKAFSYSDPETSSDSEEDALRRLNSHPHPPPDTLTIQAEDGPAIVDAGTTSSSCTEEHSPAASQQQVQVLQGRNYPAGIGGSQVRLVLLPSKKQRRKTRVKQGNSPQYMESFLLPRVNPEDVNAMGVRLRVYLWGGRMRRERLLGEARVSFDQINLQLETTLWLTLQPPPSSVQDWGTSSSLTRSDSTGSQQSVQSYASPTIPPYGSSMKGGSVAEILIGLSYNGTTGRLSVEIIKGSHFRGGGGNDTKPPDTYVKLALVDSNGHEMSRSKTGLKRAQPNPLYKETFVFQVALFQLGDVTLLVSVYNRRRGGMGKKGREMIGWLCLGFNSSGSEKLQHWNDMRAARQPTQVQRWHSLLRP